MNIYSHFNSKYEKWYYSIIEKAISENRNKSDKTYYESHHILPRSLGGTDDKNNIVLLTYREHLLCHWLLYKFVEGEQKSKMAFAFWSMINLKSKRNKREGKITPLKIAEAAKLAHIQTLSEKMSGDNNPMKNPDVARKNHLSQIGQKRPSVAGKNNGMYGKTHSLEVRKKLAEMGRKRKGETKSNKMRSKLSQTTTGRKRKYLEDGSWTWYYPDKI